MNVGPGMDLVRSIFALIDRGIYSLIPMLYDLIIQLAKMSIFTNENINDFASRIYVFLGIIMLFKVTFSLIQYLVNPDTLNDKSVGAGNLVKNIIITLFLIIIVPFGFDLLYTAQSAILNDNLIPRLILGTTGDEVGTNQVIMDFDDCVTTNANGEKSAIGSAEGEASGDYIALTTFRPFYQIYDGNDNASQTTLSESMITDYCGANSVSDLLQPNIYLAEDYTGNDSKYVVEYSILISTAVGVLVLLLLLEFCFDVAMRCIKLGFLEIAAPIAIITYIDPKSSKNGAFTKWLKEVMKTWARLFIRLAILYFVVYFIDIVDNNLEMYSENSMWIILFLIIGALLFAKKAISLIEDIFGIKFDHSIQLNPFKKISDQALFGKQVAALPGKTLAAGVGLGLSAGGAIIGHRLKSADMRKKEKELNKEQKALDRMKGQLQEEITRRNNLMSVAHKSPQAFRAAQIAESEIKNQHKKYMEQKAVVDNAKVGYESAVKKYEKDTSDNEGNPYFSSVFPITSTIMQSLRGAKVGFDSKEITSIAKAISAGIAAAKKSAKRTNDFDKFGYLDRLKDLGTDLTGVKNESGTTSIVKKEMKEQTELLNNIRNAISSLEHSFGNLQPGSIVYDKNGKFTINESGNYKYAEGERENIESLIKQYEALRENEKATTKQIKEYEDVLAINKPKK